MKPILIKFGDNDFYNTFVPLLRAIKEVGFTGTKADLIELINNALFGFYCVYQSKGMTPKSLTDYLRVNAGDVFYGDEVSEFFKDGARMSQCNSDCYYIYPDMPDVGVL